MESEFWQQSWEDEGSKTSFHRKDIHPYLLKYTSAATLQNKRVLVPLCGKTNDLIWFRNHAEHVVGVELVEKPILQFFTEQRLPYRQVSPQCYKSERLTILKRDFLTLQPEDVGHIDLVYDRAALVALPLEMRLRYLDKIDQLLPIGSYILLNVVEYTPYLPEPPFSITPLEVQSYYAANYTIKHLESPELPGHGMVHKFNLTSFKEHFFLLHKVNHVTFNTP